MTTSANISVCKPNSPIRISGSTELAGNIPDWQAVVLIIGLGVFVVLMAKLFGVVRKHVFNDEDDLDTAFDAGGKVTVGLTATTIVSQWTWAATLLQSSAVASKFGISGPFWYAAGATIQILLFAMISAQLKIRAPGAKTFLQVIWARFGKKTHIVFCGFALTTNIIVTSMLMLGGVAVLTNLVRDLCVEYATMLIAVIIGTYTFIGGLGATFYVSYVNTAVLFIGLFAFMIRVFHADDDQNALGSIEKIYELLKCSNTTIEGNVENSYLTFLSFPGLIFGIINVIGNFGTVFVDQSYWQSSVAAKPKEGVWGFLLGGIIWFSVPFAFATTMGLAYIALGTNQGQPLLTMAQVDAGLVPPVVAQKLMGTAGEFLMVIILIMAVTSTGSAEVIAVTSIIIYDIYGIHLKPYRKVLDANSCVLCGRQRGRMANPRDKCVCTSKNYCQSCTTDDQQRAACTRATKPAYKCRTHGHYRSHNDYLSTLKNWGILFVSLAIVPLTLVLRGIGISLGWVYNFMGIVIGSAVIPITLAMFWQRLNAEGMVIGALVGMVTGIVSWLIKSALLPGGLRNFIANTGDQYSMLTGNIAAILTGGCLTVVVSLITNRSYDACSGTEIWENTRDIDNPLSPWTELYSKELQLSGLQTLDNRPSMAEVAATFKTAKLTAYVGALSASFVLILLWPACMVSIGVMDSSQFAQWVYTSETWAFLAGIAIIILPVVNEAMSIRTALREKSRVFAIEISPRRMAATASARPRASIEEEVGQPAQTNGDVIHQSTVSAAVARKQSSAASSESNQPVFG
ncbi:uncharacterized protein LOC141908541 [Tubulanus polymorphus]|uniref:uncharacterized protein LOC141908541 n=1 Tax=Tubulanus polymorphus TaxID=672921 RepID=UPI003DA4CAFC